MAGVGNLTKRILFAAVAIPVVMGALWLGGWWLVGAIAALGVLGTREVYDLARRQGIEPLAWPGYAAAVATPFAIGLLLVQPGIGLGIELLFTCWLLTVLVIAMRRGPASRPLAAVSVTCLGPLYTALPLSFLPAIRHSSAAPSEAAGFALALFPLVLTWICDTFAYMVGSQVGGPKMAPVLSPNKTWSGAVGGTIGAIVAAALLGQVVTRLGWSFSLVQLMGVGLAVGIVAQVGDVAESLFKREAGVKDSSSLIPGHGGVLDRLDSLYFVIPVSTLLIGLYLSL
jgi:phosphatidate cytidylyltransferase